MSDVLREVFRTYSTTEVREFRSFCLGGFCEQVVELTNGSYPVPLPRIDNVIGEGLDLAIQAERVESALIEET